ncbi:MAG: response regulator [Pseudomonadota bacterium]
MSPQLRSILIVEDDPDIREIAALSLEALGGFSVATAESGAEALVKAPDLVPDLILLDYMMPGMDGGEVLAALRADPRLARIPIAFMTAKVRPDEVARLKALGAVAVIAKPFDPGELPNEIARIWNSLNG